MTSVVAPATGSALERFLIAASLQRRSRSCKARPHGRISDQNIFDGLAWGTRIANVRHRIVNISAGGDDMCELSQRSDSPACEDCTRHGITSSALSATPAPAGPSGLPAASAPVGDLGRRSRRPDSLNRAKRGMYRSLLRPTIDGLQKPESFASSTGCGTILPGTPTASRPSCSGGSNRSEDKTTCTGIIQANAGIGSRS